MKNTTVSKLLQQISTFWETMKFTYVMSCWYYSSILFCIMIYCFNFVHNSGEYSMMYISDNDNMSSMGNYYGWTKIDIYYTNITLIYKK